MNSDVWSIQINKSHLYEVHESSLKSVAELEVIQPIS